MGYCAIVGYDVETQAIVLSYALYRSSEAVSDAYWGELQKIGRLDMAAKSFAAKGAALVILAVLVLQWGGKLHTSFALSAVVAVSITIFYDRIQYKKLAGQKKAYLSLPQILGPLRSCFALLLTTMFPMILAAIPRIFLERYSGAELLGYYGNVSAPTALISSLVPSVLVPIMTWYGKLLQEGKKKKLLQGFFLSLSVCVLLGMVACIAVWIAGEWVMIFVFTQAILPYVRYLCPLIWSTVIYAWTMCANSVLISVRETRAVSAFSGIALLTAGAISNWLVREMAIPGAILVLAAAYSLQFLLQMLWIIMWYRKTVKSSPMGSHDIS